MAGSAAGEARERAVRWLEDGQGHVGTVLGLLNDYHRLQGAHESAERECERLRGLHYENERLRNQIEAAEHEVKKLREEISLLRSEAERHLREREDIAASLSQAMNEVLVRVRGDHARA